MALKGLHRLELTDTLLIQSVAREHFLQQPQNQCSNAVESNKLKAKFVVESDKVKANLSHQNPFFSFKLAICPNFITFSFLRQISKKWVRALNVSNLLRLAFLFPCSWYLELNYYLFKSKTNKQTNKQLGDFFPPSSAFFPHSWPLFKAMLVTNLRA